MAHWLRWGFRHPLLRIALASACMVATASGATVASADTRVLPLILPDSTFLSNETRTILAKERLSAQEEANNPHACPSDRHAAVAQMPAIRKCYADALYKSTFYQHLRQQFAVEMTPARVGGVYTEVFVPKNGIAPKNQGRVLINVHGGGFLGGSRTSSHIES